MSAAHDTQALEFPARILTVIHELADRKGTATHGPAKDANGEPLQDDADAALAWIAARQEERPVLSEKEAFMRTLGWQPRATLAAGSQAVQVPGWRCVPVEPTEEMHAAAVRTIIRCSGNADFPPRVWRAMLAAAPLQPLAGGEATNA